MARRLVFAILALALQVPSANAQVPFALQGVDSNDFEVTRFSSGLNFPVGMAELPDGSILVGVSNGTLFGASSGALVRLADTNGDGVADVEQTLADNVPNGGLSSVRVVDDLVFATGQGRAITIYRMGANVDDTYTLMGRIDINDNQNWLHPHSSLAVRATDQANVYEMFFQLGSKTNFDDTSATSSYASTIGISGQLNGDAIHRITITDHGDSISGSNVTQIATGLRNAAGMVFAPFTGDLYLQDNGIDGLVNANEPHSADELNVIPAGDVGAVIADFGFPNNYTAYRTGTIVGGQGVQPLVAFQPLDGAESEGPNDIALTPPFFPRDLRGGMFIGMHGRYSSGGLSNEENPLVFADLETGEYFHIIENTESGVGHLDGLLSTDDSLFVADISPQGHFSSSARNTGVLYQIRSVVPNIDVMADDDVDCGDLAALQIALASGASDPRYDLTGDGAFDDADLEQWLVDAAAYRQGPGVVYRAGDANLDGMVDSDDLQILQEHLFSASSDWCDGDFNSDANVDVRDFNIWNDANQPAAGLTVPEPVNQNVVLYLAMLSMSCVWRRPIRH